MKKCTSEVNVDLHLYTNSKNNILKGIINTCLIKDKRRRNSFNVNVDGFLARQRVV
jgi:hypothetical protein